MLNKTAFAKPVIFILFFTLLRITDMNGNEHQDRAFPTYYRKYPLFIESKITFYAINTSLYNNKYLPFTRALEQNNIPLILQAIDSLSISLNSIDIPKFIVEYNNIFPWIVETEMSSYQKSTLSVKESFVNHCIESQRSLLRWLQEIKQSYNHFQMITKSERAALSKIYFLYSSQKFFPEAWFFYRQKSILQFTSDFIILLSEKDKVLFDLLDATIIDTTCLSECDLEYDSENVPTLKEKIRIREQIGNGDFRESGKLDLIYDYYLLSPKYCEVLTLSLQNANYPTTGQPICQYYEEQRALLIKVLQLTYNPSTQIFLGYSANR